MHGPIHYTAREAGAAVKLLVGLPCPKQIKYVLDYGVLSSKESLLSFSLHFSLHSPSLTVTTGTYCRMSSLYLCLNLSM